MLHVGKEIAGQPHKRLVVVHDGTELTEVQLSTNRIVELETAYAPMAHIVLGDGRDVQGFGRVATATEREEALQNMIGQLAYGEARARARVSKGLAASAADANETYAFAPSQLNYLQQRTFERIYAPMQYRDVVPVTNEAGPWADNVDYETEDGVGMAAWASGKDDEIPWSDAEFGRTGVPIHHMVAGYRYTLQQLRQAAYLRRPLNERRLYRAQQMVERKMNKVAIFGDSSKNLLGLLNQTNANQICVGGSLGTTLTGNWDAAATTADQILFDINFGLNYIYTATEFNYVCTDLLVPKQAWQRLVSTPRSAYSDKTILQYLLENNISRASKNVTLRIGPLLGADTAGASTTGGSDTGKGRAIFYINDPQFMEFHIPMPLMFQAPQLHNLEVRTPGEARCGGLNTRYKQSLFYMDNVLA